MKISHAKVLITFLCYIDLAFPDYRSVTVNRLLQRGGRWNQGIDSFTIPPSVCHKESSEYGSYCNTSCTLRQEEGSEGYYSCDCSDESATVTYLNNTWRCLGNQEIRTLLGCQKSILFDKEKTDYRLRTLNTRWKWWRKTKLNKREAKCKVNASSSWYIGCDGKMVSLERHTNRTTDIFRLQWNKKIKAYLIKVFEPEPIDFFMGRVINLGISCLGYRYNKERCLLFKLEGKFTCPVSRPTSTMSSNYLEVTSPSTTILKTTGGFSINPTQTITRSNSGRKQKNEGDNSSSSLSIIAGVTSSVTLVLLLIAAIFIYRRRKTRKDAHTGASGQTDKKTVLRSPKTNLAFQLEEQNGSVTDHGRENPISSVNTPCYAAPQHSPEPVYNVLEDPYSEVTEEPAWYCSTPVEGSVYSTLENPNQYTGSEPVYNVLEEPKQSGAAEDDSYGSSGLQDPVYNVLEGPDPESSEDGLLEREDTGGCKANIPVYAVVDKKKKTKP